MEDVSKQNTETTGAPQLKKKLGTLGVKPVKVKALMRDKFAFATFRNEEEREDAIKKINGFVWKGNTLKAKKAKPTADPLLMKRKLAQDDGGEPAEKKGKVETEEDQLPVGIRSEHNGKFCELLEIKPSPVLENYRNKCEFTIGKDINGLDNTVGFRYGQYRQGTSRVGEPDNVTIIPESMKNVVKSFQAFIRSTEYGAFNPENHEGHWKMLTVRTCQGPGVLVIADFHPQNLSQDSIQKVKEDLKNYFGSGPGSGVGVTSLFFRLSDKTSSNDVEHVLGEKNIEEDLLGMKFKISPNAFFQVNTLAAEVLYKLVADWCNVSPSTTVLDICCGTGTIGLTLAKKVSSVVGIEMCQEAIKDAKCNAQLNDIDNVRYYCDKAENVIGRVMKSVQSSKHVVAVVDPPRAGLNFKVVQTLRGPRSRIKHLVYVSCNLRGASSNFIDLTRKESKRLKGVPFRPVKAIPVDLFPQTNHCETVILFEREIPDTDITNSPESP
ncbi:hypothetical protein KUTeg_009367 [Tegillarca granosa]|uniref:tRNA (uracil(54)-C(5))-methyltransferase n=1 Tax=Tegillarca granosa TaxID=220873 RepID=A0ABQ9F3L9_TEGGR|nr:hypothetical protein KUTeg_009367 [Tegillarca granosa]